ncbi:MAG TPA: 30S ribosomal protein S4 [Nitrospiraceae bacterium]|nr:30S ribosomal protein S4 [Nitrospiraceae bacterium]
MARYRGSVCKLCRREGTKLFLKSERCYTDKCGIVRRNYPPGQHGQGRIKLSVYAQQLREKQKIRRLYGVLESQFRGYFEKAARMRGITGDNLILLLERRLDNVVQRMGFAGSKKEARQIVRHGHMLVNGRRVTIPSYLLKAGDTVELREKSRAIAHIAQTLATVEKRGFPSWLKIDAATFQGKVVSLPARDECTLPTVQEQLVVELYSK